ncbi:MAG: hypothetical protein AB7G25_13885, partial [Sphingomonadaceae bacterium]
MPKVDKISPVLLETLYQPNDITRDAQREFFPSTDIGDYTMANWSDPRSNAAMRATSVGTDAAAYD